MERMENLDFKLSFWGYDKCYVDEIISEKDRLIQLQKQDMQSLKNEIRLLKQQINYSKNKRK